MAGVAAKLKTVDVTPTRRNSGPRRPLNRGVKRVDKVGPAEPADQPGRVATVRRIDQRQGRRPAEGPAPRPLAVRGAAVARSRGLQGIENALVDGWAWERWLGAFSIPCSVRRRLVQEEAAPSLARFARTGTRK